MISLTPSKSSEMPTELVLRPGHEGDSDCLASIYLQARAAAPMPAPVHTEAAIRYWLSGRLAEDEVWVAETGGQPVGYARLTPTWLDDLYVLPTHQGDGVGSALLDLACQLRPNGLSLWVFESNQPAQAFYDRHGFVELERTDGSANEERQPDIRMVWPGDKPLQFFRGQIDEVDVQLGDLLARRAALTAAVQPLKTTPGRDPQREAEIARAVAERAPALGEERVARIIDAIITESIGAARVSNDGSREA